MDLATGAIGSIISKLADILKAEYKLQTGVKAQIESLTHELRSAHAFLQEIDKVPPDQLNGQVKIWASEVRDSSYDMDDVLDAFLVRVMGAKPVKKKKLIKRLKEKIGSLFSKAKARHDIANAIEEVTKKVEEVDERRRRYELGGRVPISSATPSPCIDPRIAAVYRAKASLPIGIDERKDAVIRMLSQGDDDTPVNKTKVVSLLGFGGVGKTTLAKATYDQLKPEYECAAFVSVGQKPDLVKVFKDILFDLGFTDIHSTHKGADLLIRELLEFLRNKRYLIVIDDVWETESRKAIVEALADDDIGSRTIITTRKSEITIGGVYRVQPLSDYGIFGGEDKCPGHERQQVSEAADKILRKCGGIPLAIITMASLLVGKSMEEWSEVCNSIRLRDREKEQIGDTMWILSLSYYDLPSHPKTCLLYLSVFPEDYLIKKDALIWLWIAEGFVNTGKPEIGLFETGEGYFNELVNRSLIQPVEESDCVIVEGCRVHDMILDLIRSLSREANLTTVLDNGEEIFTGSSDMARRLALQNRVVEDTPQDNCIDTARARSFIAVRGSFVPQVHLQNFKLLRVLHLDGCYKVEFDKEHVGELHHLRYLGILDGFVDMYLPNEIGALKFLQVLYLDALYLFGLLPSSVGMLTQLVCLHAPAMILPCGAIKDLTSLQELLIHGPGYNDESYGRFVKDLRNLSELRVLAVHSNDKMDERMQMHLLTSIGCLHKLQHLDLEGMHNHGLPSCIDPSHLPKLSYLHLTLPSLGDHGLKILGDLPQLCYLWLDTSGHATLTGAATRGYFPKLRSCGLLDSSVQFVVDEEDSSVSFTIWDAEKRDDAPAFGSKRKQDSCTVARGASIMPNLESLCFRVNVRELIACSNGSCNHLGLEYLSSLQKVVVDLECEGAHVDVVEAEEAALRRTFQVHPNRPTLQINRIGEPEVNRDSSPSGGDDLAKGDGDNKEELLSTMDEGVTHQSRSSGEDEDEPATHREGSS